MTSECIYVCCDLQQGDTNKNRTKGGWQQKSKGPKKTAKSKKKETFKEKIYPCALITTKATEAKAGKWSCWECKFFIFIEV